MWSQFFEQLFRIGVVSDERGKDPQKVVRPRVHYMDVSELDPKDETNWSHCFHPTQPQIFGNAGKKLSDGQHGVGETPNNFIQGTYVASMRATSSGQETFVLGAIPTMGGKGEG